VLDATVTLLMLAAFLLTPTVVGRATRNAWWALLTALGLTIPATILQAADTNLPGFAILIAGAGVLSATLGVAAARSNASNGASG
jgi:hypothetical protein